MASPCKKLSAKVVIVGGGFAGIAAASKLSKAGYTDFLLLEAQDRLGGRAYTKKYGDGAIDMGAQYIHGAEGNPVYDIALKLGNICSDSDSSSESDDYSNDADDNCHRTNSFHMPDGTLINSTIVKEVHDLIEAILEEGNKFSRENLPNIAEDSLGTFLHKQFFKMLNKSNDSSDVRKIKESLFHWRLLFEKTENACKSIYEMSLYSWGEYLECGGDREYELKNGFKPIIDEISKPVPRKNIMFRTAVNAIYWDMERCQPPSLRTNHLSSLKAMIGKRLINHNGVNEGESDIDCDSLMSKVVLRTKNDLVIVADHVLVTCPLGFLKKHADSLFKPLLPNDKLMAIHRMGFGTVDKIYLEFDEPFWDNNCDSISFVWTQDEPFVMNCVNNAHHTEYLHHDWYRGIHGFNTVAGQRCLLEGWVAGDEAQIMETVPDDVVLKVCHEMLQRFMGDCNIPKPKSIFRSCWYSDPYSWGSYSYIKDGATADDCDTLARPLPNQQRPLLLFAGEATHRTYFSTVHGAMLSGQREADNIIKHLAADRTEKI